MKKAKKFDEAAFDRKVCEITYMIHRKARSISHDNTFDKWLDQNINHVVKLYEISELECDFNDFCKWVFDNSQ